MREWKDLWNSDTFQTIPVLHIIQGENIKETSDDSENWASLFQINMRYPPLAYVNTVPCFMVKRVDLVYGYTNMHAPQHEY